MNENKVVPNIRFKGFEGDWNQDKAINIFKNVSDKNHPELPVLSASQEDGMVLRKDINIDIKYKNSSLTTYKKVEPGQFVIHLRSFQGGFAYSTFEGITSPAYTILAFIKKENHYKLFWKQIFLSGNFIRRLKTITYGVRDGKSISYNDFGSLNIYFPFIKEQQKIGDFFSKLDKLLDLQQQKIDKLELLKKTLLQKLFPRHDAKIPEFRFKGFEDEWEPKYLGKLGFFESGNGFPKNEQGKKIGIPFFKVSDLGSSFKLTKAKNYVAPEQIKSNKWKVIDPTKNGAIVFAKIGAAIFLNRKRLVMKPFLIDNNLMAYVISENVNRNFVMANIQMINFSKFVQVGAIPSINSGDLKKIKISQPINLSEQQKIGNLLSKVDQLIELENKKLQDFQQAKKCLLQNMFVE